MILFPHPLSIVLALVPTWVQRSEPWALASGKERGPELAAWALASGLARVPELAAWALASGPAWVVWGICGIEQLALYRTSLLLCIHLPPKTSHQVHPPPVCNLRSSEYCGTQC